MTVLETALVRASVVLFAAALIVELARLTLRRPRSTTVALALVVTALGVEAAAIAVRWASVGHGPVMHAYEHSLAGSWILVVAFLATAGAARRIRGTLAAVLGLALAMLANALAKGPAGGPLLPAYESPWLWIHVAFAWLAYGSFLVAAVFSGALLARGTPTEAALDEGALRVALFGFACQTVMLGSGAIWARGLWGRYWSWDPIETWSLVTWLLYGLYLHLRLTYGWRGRRAAWLAVGAAVAVLVAFGGMGFAGGVHTRLL